MAVAMRTAAAQEAVARSISLFPRRPATTTATATMHLMYYTDDAGKRIYTLLVRVSVCKNTCSLSLVVRLVEWLGIS